MKVINAGFEILTPIDGVQILKHIELCGRVCYKSEDRITEDSSRKFIKSILERGHESVLEHFSITVRFIVDRGISHEIVRHRLASYSQESTRYCNYSKDGFENEITVIGPEALNLSPEAYANWKLSCERAERGYFGMLETGCTPQAARSVLPNSLKTEVIMTANLREWRHFLKLRTSLSAHPQMREITIPLLREFQSKILTIFSDIEVCG